MRQYLCLLLLFIAVCTLQAQDLPEPMQPFTPVNDFANLFETEEIEDLEQRLLEYENNTSTQIYIVTVTDLQGYAASDYATKLFQKWGIGQKDTNNGVLILFKPRIGDEYGEVFISTGYGVEHILTDGRVGRIIDEYMMYNLKRGDYYGASLDGINVIIECLSGEFSGVDDPPTPFSVPPILLKIVYFFLFIVSCLAVMKVVALISGNSGGKHIGGGSSGHSSSSGGSFSRSSSSRSSSSRGGGGGSSGGGGAGRRF